MAEAVALPRTGESIRPAPNALSRAFAFILLLARRKPLGFLSLLVIVFMLIVAAVPGVFAIHGPGEQSGESFQPYCLGPSDTFLCPTDRDEGVVVGGVQVTQGTVVEGDRSYPLGADRLGRDIYSRLVYGTRVAVQVGFGAVLLSSLIALAVGVSSGYFGGWYDATIQRVVDSVMAFPPLVVLLALPNLIGGPSVTKLVIILGVLGGVGGSRVIRASTLGLRSAQYIEAARTIGSTDARIMIRHIVPNIFGPLMVQATIGLGGTILAEAALGFLGLGLQSNDRPTWGYMLNLAQGVAAQEPWQAVWPGLAIAIAVFSFNMLGDALRDLLDPRLRGARGSYR